MPQRKSRHKYRRTRPRNFEWSARCDIDRDGISSCEGTLRPFRERRQNRSGNYRLPSFGRARRYVAVVRDHAREDRVLTAARPQERRHHDALFGGRGLRVTRCSGKRVREIDQRPWLGVDSGSFFAENPTNRRCACWGFDVSG